MLERVAQIPLVVAGTYNTHNLVSHGRNNNSDEAHDSVSHVENSNKNSDARLHNENLASANSIFWRFSLWYLNRGATCDGAMDGPSRITINLY